MLKTCQENANRQNPTARAKLVAKHYTSREEMFMDRKKWRILSFEI